MRPCPHCNQLIVESAPSCFSCGGAVEPTDPLPDRGWTTTPAGDDGPHTPAEGSEPPTPQLQQTADTGEPQPSRRLSPMLVLGALGLIGAVVLMAGLGEDPTAEVADAVVETPVVMSGPAPGLASPPAPSPPMSDTGVAPPLPVWSRAAWAEHMRGATAFELRAVSSVQVATRRFWPKLGVSCASGTTSVYVITGGGAKIEPDTADYIVALAFDDAPGTTQRWLPAEDYQAIFASDPIDIVKRMVESSILRVEYAHYQSGQVAVDFDVRGAEEVAASVARRCRWKLPS